MTTLHRGDFNIGPVKHNWKGPWRTFASGGGVGALWIGMDHRSEVWGKGERFRRKGHWRKKVGGIAPHPLPLGGPWSTKLQNITLSTVEKNPNWSVPNQLAIYKGRGEVESGSYMYLTANSACDQIINRFWTGDIWISGQATKPRGHSASTVLCCSYNGFQLCIFLASEVQDSDNYYY